MTRLATALVLFAGGLVAIGQHDTDRPVVSATTGKHRPPHGKASRSMRRLPVPHPSATPRRTPTPRVTPSRGARQLLTVTMYCYTGSRNAAGKWPTVGTAAGNAWPLGTRVHVQSVGVVVIEDRSAPGATDVDLYGGTDAGCEQRAIEWGRRDLYVSEVAA